MFQTILLLLVARFLSITQAAPAATALPIVDLVDRENIQLLEYSLLAGKAPFQQAILQSAAFQNVNQIPGNFQQEEAFNGFLLLLNVSTLQEARQLPSSALVQANIRQVGASAYGLNTYGPVIDGLFAPGIPGKLLLQGSFDHNLKLMLGYNANEGLVFTSPFLPNDTSYDDYFESSFPSISPRVASYVQNVLYPAPSDNTPYEDNIGRASVTIAESTFVCNTIYLERAFGNQTYTYQFSVPPALHGQDVDYTFFNGPDAAVESDATAVALQEYITSFAATGMPSGPSLPRFPLYGNDSRILNLNATSITEITDPIAKEGVYGGRRRCTIEGIRKQTCYRKGQQKQV
ncbi:MAG: hypothetical protein L6R38_007644 [Xanthoria sp. 2 TBL-2021]|nr:MAG: hypothetical protein L6R38_007644 [Xanthoria sp. 2 TBL-2021]